MRYRKEIFLFLLLSLLCTLPVMGVTTYSGASPHMSAAISGVNEFSPGQDATISVIVQNSGISTIESVDYPCIMGSTQTICDSAGPIHATMTRPRQKWLRSDFQRVRPLSL